MIYVMETTRHDWKGESSYSRMLHEMTPREFAKAQADAEQANKTPHEPALHVRYERWTGQQARRYVLDGGTHATGLWFDGVRIRYAPRAMGEV